jgi:3-dehydroquinate dehydratase-1
VAAQICVPIMEKTVKAAAKRAGAASKAADLVEFRLDSLAPGETNLQAFFSAARVPVIATNRPKREGGMFKGSAAQRVALLERCVGKAGYIDIELSTPAGLRGALVKRAKRAGTKVIVSFHDTKRTPPVRALEKVLAAERRAGADIAKIVTAAQVPEDNAACAWLYEKAGGFPLVSWAMGPAGRPSRFIAIALGSPIAFASLGGKGSAPGQPTVKETRRFSAISAR